VLDGLADTSDQYRLLLRVQSNDGLPTYEAGPTMIGFTRYVPAGCHGWRFDGKLFKLWEPQMGMTPSSSRYASRFRDARHTNGQERILTGYQLTSLINLLTLANLLEFLSNYRPHSVAQKRRILWIIAEAVRLPKRIPINFHEGRTCSQIDCVGFPVEPRSGL